MRERMRTSVDVLIDNGSVRVSAEAHACKKCKDDEDCPINKFKSLIMLNHEAADDPHFPLAELAKEAGLVDKFQMERPNGTETHYGDKREGANGRFEIYYCEHKGIGRVITQQNDMIGNPPAIIDPEASKAESEELWGPDCLDDPLPSDKFQKISSQSGYTAAFLHSKCIGFTAATKI